MKCRSWKDRVRGGVGGRSPHKALGFSRNSIKYVIDTKALSFFNDETFWYFSAFCCVDFFIFLKFTEDSKAFYFIKIILIFTVLEVKTENFNILTHLKNTNKWSSTGCFVMTYRGGVGIGKWREVH